MFFHITTKGSVDEAFKLFSLSIEPVEQVGINAHCDRHLRLWHSQSCLREELVVQRRNIRSVYLLIRQLVNSFPIRL